GRHAHQQPAVAPATNSHVLWRGDAVLDQLLRDGREIVIDALPVLLQPGTMPLRSEFAAAPDVGEHVCAAALEPGRPRVRAVARCVRDLEPAVGAEQRGVVAIPLEIATMDDEIRNPRSVL